MQNSTAAWALRNWVAYSPAVATQALSRASTERSHSNGNTRSFKGSRLAIFASASDRLPLNRQTSNKIAWFSPDTFGETAVLAEASAGRAQPHFANRRAPHGRGLKPKLQPDV